MQRQLPSVKSCNGFVVQVPIQYPNQKKMFFIVRWHNSLKTMKEGIFSRRLSDVTFSLCVCTWTARLHSTQYNGVPVLFFFHIVSILWLCLFCFLFFSGLSSGALHASPHSWYLLFWNMFYLILDKAPKILEDSLSFEARLWQAWINDIFVQPQFLIRQKSCTSMWVWHLCVFVCVCCSSPSLPHLTSLWNKDEKTQPQTAGIQFLIDC